MSSCYLPTSNTGPLWGRAPVHDLLSAKYTQPLPKVDSPKVLTALSSKSRDVVISICKPVNSQLTAKSTRPALSFPSFPPRATGLLDTWFSSQVTIGNMLNKDFTSIWWKSWLFQPSVSVSLPAQQISVKVIHFTFCGSMPHFRSPSLCQ